MYKRQALDSVNELESTLDQSKESMYKLSYVVRVTAPDLEELKRRCNCLLYTSTVDISTIIQRRSKLGVYFFIPEPERT